MKIFLLLIYISFSLYASDVIELFKNKSNLQSDIKSLSNPFETIKIKKIKSVKKSSNHKFKLEAIVNNSVKIDGKWYKLHDKISSFTIYLIKSDRVYLKSESTVKILDINRKKRLYISSK
jgi:hypothetical protein